MNQESERLARERQRILSVYQRRRQEIAHDFYAPWKTWVLFLRAQRSRFAAEMLADAGVFPGAGDSCLEVGFGSGGWLTELIGWGVQEKNVHGIELDPIRAESARELLPVADLRIGDASRMPWADGTFRLVIASTVFTSILDNRVRGAVAGEIVRVLALGGALLWYDFAVNNPRNPNVRGVNRRELRALFPDLRGRIRSVTLAPPLARFVTPRSWVAATLLEAFPLLRTHLIAVLVKRK